jgi:hypothetical protein
VAEEDIAEEEMPEVGAVEELIKLAKLHLVVKVETVEMVVYLL